MYVELIGFWHQEWTQISEDFCIKFKWVAFRFSTSFFQIKWAFNAYSKNWLRFVVVCHNGVSCFCHFEFLIVSNAGTFWKWPCNWRNIFSKFGKTIFAKMLNFSNSWKFLGHSLPRKSFNHKNKFNLTHFLSCYVKSSLHPTPKVVRRLLTKKFLHQLQKSRKAA